MRKLMLGLAVGLVSTLLAGGAWAATGQASQPDHQIYNVQGSVKAVDPGSHLLTIDTDKGEMVLLIGPGAVIDDENQTSPVSRLGDLHKGDEVKVQYEANRSGNGQMRLEGRHVTRRAIEHTEGTVASVDTWERTLSVKSDEGVESYKVDPNSSILEVRNGREDLVPLTNVKDGDYVVLQYAQRGNERILRRATLKKAA